MPVIRTVKTAAVSLRIDVQPDCSVPYLDLDVGGHTYTLDLDLARALIVDLHEKVLLAETFNNEQRARQEAASG